MNKHYCCTDLHGMYSLWQQIRDYCDETDIIYFLGDAIDRGKYGLQIMKELLQDKRVIYIKGNHECFIENNIINIIEERPMELALWKQNGGQPTIRSLKRLSEDSQRWYLRKVNEMPDYLIYTNTKNQTVLLSHAGTDPWDIEDKTPNRYGESPWQWDREHIYSKWDDDPRYKDTYIVHGHTPVPHAMRALNQAEKFCGRQPRYSTWDFKILEYADGHKFDLDLGSADTGWAVLFDLDKLEAEQYFYDDSVERRKK